MVPVYGCAADYRTCCWDSARPQTNGGKTVRDWLALYAQDDGGYQNLCRLVSMAHLDHAEDADPQVSFDQLAEFTDGLIALTAGGEGALARLFADGQSDAAADYCDATAGLVS